MQRDDAHRGVAGAVCAAASVFALQLGVCRIATVSSSQHSSVAATIAANGMLAAIAAMGAAHAASSGVP